MSERDNFDLIYLNKKDSSITNDWIYYRLKSKGADQDPIEVCKVAWPTFADINLIWDESSAMVSTPGLTGLSSAYEQICSLLLSQWSVDHNKSIVIGLLPSR